MKKIVLLLILFYRKCISPHFLPRCRYIPSCSAYAYEALQVHGFFMGSFLALWRVFRCHPFCKGGTDAVPPKGFYKHGLW
ncbi:MAG: membrane protein insertion efficiency factor YidD [Defluviitaleaceae bacterium]|nr:membrane protein insertion efficiency factor YidD [Defluviitaleaceae bacterium]